jgi:4-carboxymuconolactone decarboxylase
MDDRERYQEGMIVRREVLGDAHVDRTLERLSDFNEDFQNLITRYAWGEIWTRPGLERKTRILITVALLVAANRPEEFRMYVKAAIQNGVTQAELKEVLLQTAIYCGLPAANASFRAAEEVLAALDSKS